MKRSAAITLVLLAAISGGACDGIGRPLVAKKKVSKVKTPTGLCTLAPSCNDDRLDDIASQIALINVSPLDLLDCGASFRPCTVGIDAVGHPFSDKCTAGFSNAQAPAGIDGHTFDCTAISITVLGEHPDPVLLDAPQLQHTEVFIETIAPVFVQIDNALLDDVRFTLHGPVTLRISHSRTFKGVRIVGSAPDTTTTVDPLGPDAQNQLRIELQGVDGFDVNISGEDGPFAGTIAIEKASLEDTRIEAKTVNLTTMALSASSLRVSSLDTSNATIMLTTLAFDDGHLAGSQISQTEITECKSLAIITGTLSHMRIASCDEPIRVYGATIELAFMDGQIQADLAKFENVLFGAHTATDLLAWDTDIFTSNFCAHARTTRLGAAAFVLCPSCDPDDVFIVCADSQSAQKIETSQCAAFKNPDDCGLALPDRPKPPL